MKNLKFNFKSIVQSKARWLLTLIAILTLGVGQMWADNAVTVYCAISDATKGSYTLKVKANIGDNNTWREYTMSQVDDVTYRRMPLYTATIYEKYGGVNELYFNLYSGDTEKGWSRAYDSWTTSGSFSGKIFIYNASNTGSWDTYKTDHTVYWVNTEDKEGTPKVHLWNGESTEWPGVAMESTGKTYQGHAIYTYTTLAEDGIFNIGGDSYKTADLEFDTNAGRMYLGQNSGWNDYHYDHKVIFHSNGGSGSMSNQTMPYNISTSLTANGFTAPTGHQFAGWATTSGGTAAYEDSESIKLTDSDLELYAKWTPNTYSIGYKDEGDEDYSGSNLASLPDSYTYGTGIASLTNGVKSGYTFDGWFANSSCTGDAVTSISSSATGDKTFYAKWSEDLAYYTITYGAGTSYTSYGSVSEGSSYASGSSQTSGTEISLTASPNTHYKLEGWYSDASCSSKIDGAGTDNPYVFDLSADTSVYAKFVIKQCTITLNKNGGSTGAASVTATHGSTLPSFTAHSRTGYILNGYYTESSGGTKIIDASGALVASTDYANSSKQWNNDATALTLYAQWTAKTTTVTLDNQSATTAGTEEVTATYGSAMPSATMPTKNYYTFGGYYTGTSGSGTQYYAANGSSANNWNFEDETKTLYAKWTATSYTITYNLNSGSNPGGAPTSFTIESSDVTLPTPTRSGYTFDGWYANSDLSTGGVQTKIASGSYGNKEYWAKWTENKSTVTVMTNNTSWGSLKFGETSKDWGTTASVGVSTTQSIKATANSGYIFDRWELSGGAATASSLTSATITLKGDGTGDAGTAKAVFGIRYYYRGDKNSWGATQMTCHESGLYAYYTATTGAHTFQITPNSGNYDGECHTVDNSLGTITLTEVDNGFGGTKVSCPETGSHYIMIFYPSTSVNTSANPVIAAATELYDPSRATLTLNSPSESRQTLMYAGDVLPISVTAGKLNNDMTGLTFSYQYKVGDGDWQTLTPTSSSASSPDASCTWTTPSETSNKEYYVRGKLTYTYNAEIKTVYSASSGKLTVIGSSSGSKTIKVKKSPAGWVTFDGMYLWESSIGGPDWPGYAIVVNHLGGKWYELTIPEGCENFVLNNGVGDSKNGPDKHQTVDLTYESSIANNSCYNLTDDSNSESDGQKTYKYNLESTDCPSAPTVSTAEASSIVNISATLGGSISSNGNDAVTSYGYYYSTNSGLSSSNLGVGTRVEVGTDDKSGSYTKSQASLTANTTYYVIAYATNGIGTGYGDVENFTTPYKVTITNPAVGGSFSTTGVQYVTSTLDVSCTATTGYTFSSWTTNDKCEMSSTTTTDGVTTATLTPTADEATLTAVYTENMTTVTLVASPTGKGSFTSGGGAVTSVSAGVTTHPTVTAVPASGYRVNTSATVWSESSDYITISSTTAAATTITGSGTSGNSATLTATFTPNVYTITLNDNSGSGGVGSATVTFDNDNFAFASEFVAPTRTGYIFQGYFNSSDMAYGEKLIDVDGTWLSDEYEYYIDEDGNWVYPNNYTLYAGWTPITYTVTYHANGGSAKDGESDPTVTNWTYDVAQYISVPSSYFDAPTKYTLFSDDSKYWNDSEHGDGTDYAWGERSNLTSTDGDNIDLYAQWYTQVTLDKNHVDASTNGSMRVRYNQHVTYQMILPTRVGYHRSGFYTTTDGGTKAFEADGTMVSGDVSGFIDDGYWIHTFASSSDPYPTFYTHWDQNHYSVTFDANDCADYVGEATGSKASVADVAYETYVDITAGTLAREGYTFAGWSKTECATSATYMGDTWRRISYVDGDAVTLYAVWTPKTYTISFNALDGDCYTTSKTVDMGDEYGYLPTAYGKPGYEFVGWYTRPEGGTLVTEETRMVTASDHTLYAHYEKKERVYFKNTLGWESVYVTWDAEWNHESADKGAGSMGKTQELMTNIYGTDIWYKDIPASILSSWKGNIAFTSTEMQNAAWFFQGEAVFRRDFDRNTTMFVPTPNDPNKYNKNEGYGYPGTWYYSTSTDGDATYGKYINGYWMKYEDLQAGYTLKGSWDDSWSKDHYIERSNTSDSVFVYTIKGLAANTTYFFKLWKLCTNNTTGSVFSTSTIPITSATAADAAIFNAAVGSTDAQIKTTVAGDYTFKFNFSKTGAVKLTVEYPFAVNDYRVVYGYTKGSAQTFSSEYIKAEANAVDTISMFIHSQDSVDAETTRSLYIQKCTAIDGSGVPTWDDDYSAIALPTETASGKTSGVYNFKISQNGSKEATGEAIGKYDGNYYIRCDSADGGWDHYKEHPANLMTLSEYSLTQTLSAPYSHYYCQFIYTADISYTIATDYSPAICPILEGDATIGIGNKTLPSGNPASVRFTWNQETNGTFRSYLKSAQGEGNKRFLVLHGSDNKVLDADGNTIAGEGEGAEQMHANELLFSDTENWVYDLAFKAQPGAAVSIIARYNGSDRYLVGAADAWETIISGGADTKYDIAAVYDFKTNRLITTWIPSGTISEEIEEVDVLIERQYQGGGTTITFGKATEESEAGSISAKRVIGALKFDYNDLVGRVASWTPDTRAKLMYFVSFPFDVNVSDIFGLNTEYGDAFVVQHYNSKLRAEKGFFGGDGTETFWEDMPVDTVMHANVGYVVVMDNDYMNGDIGHVWDNKKSGEHVYLYFPSANDPEHPIILNSEEKTVTLPANECKINRTFNGGKLNHKYTDSNWNVMGVPIFQNHTGDATAGTPGAIFTPTEEPKDTTEFSPEFGYFYKWSTSKDYTVTAAAGFTFLPMHSYLVQYAGDVKFTQAAPAVVAAPRRALKNEENYKIELQVLNSNEDMLNRTYVELREEAVDSFALNEDLFMVTNKHAVNVYTFAGTYDVSANVLSIGSHIVQVGVIVNQAGTYTFTMPSNFSGSVTLIDTYADVRTNLALGDYEVNLPKGTNDERFLLEININKVPTAIDGAGAGQGSLKDGKAHKFIMNDMLYILKDGVLYDARGNRVK